MCCDRRQAEGGAEWERVVAVSNKLREVICALARRVKIMEYIFMRTAGHASADSIACQTRDELHEARKVDAR